MVATSREAQLGRAFVHLTDTLVATYDIVELLDSLVHHCVELLEVAEAGLVLANSEDDLQVMASTSERNSLIEALQLQSSEGPCMQSFATGEVVTVEDIRTLEYKWPAFRELALNQGFRSVHAVPLRLRGRTIGALNLFRETVGPLPDEDADVAQAFADVATIGIVQERLLSEQHAVSTQLQRALDGRVLIEQAKGVLLQSYRISADEAFFRLRDFARRNNRALLDVANSVVTRKLSVTQGELSTSPLH
ncbi:MAG TPA: GAF and ANTAR domain-containing protein [Glaciihabitans sp.]|jgi:GAF domain-containing protein|nr:GAF and ANTAR domain-containing protein [Glaciihabitans sp.]